MTNLLSKILLTLVLISIGFGSTARNKKLPLLEDYKSYNLKKNNVQKITYRVYSDENKQNMIDFIPEFYFDEQGNMTKVVVKDMENNIDITTNWEYDIKGGLFNEYRRDSLDKQIRKRLNIINKKEKEVLTKVYERWFDEFEGIEHFEVLMEESVWKEKKTAVEEDKSYYSVGDSVQTVSRKSSRRYAKMKGEDIFDVIIKSNIDSDYIWLPSYMEDSRKADSRASRTEVLPDGAKYTYKLKKGLMFEKKDFDKTGALVKHTTYTYEYDKNKNWVKLLQKENGKLVYAVFRDIEYR